MARHGDDVLRAEDRRLREDLLPHLAERQPVGGRVEVARAGPADWIGWNVTPRTHRCFSAKSMISPISSSFRPFFSVTTSVVETLCSLSRSSARRRTSRRSSPRSSPQRLLAQRVELQVHLEPRL